MTDARASNPTHTLEILLNNAKNRRRAEGLKGLNRICEGQYKTSRDFSRATIGKLCEAAGVFGSRVLYNSGSDDYRSLVKAWEEYSCPAPKAAVGPDEALWNDSLLRQIDDPALRSLVQGMRVERNRLLVELNLLKSKTTIILDRRTSAKSLSSQNADATTGFSLKPSEREALLLAVSREFLHGEGWTEGRFGEVKTATGRTLYEPGYTVAIRRLLEQNSSAHVR